MDGDGDQDLYVVNGGIETEVNGDSLQDLLNAGTTIVSESENLQDRLYLNDGNGKFAASTDEALPPMRTSGSVAAAADFDRDGDLDLFVGGRCVPARYPETPRSARLRNEGGRFIEVTQETAPGLHSAGMVTSALWSDVDGDGWSDLLVTSEWGPVALWRNDAGRLTDTTQAAGLAALTGWWNGITGGDLDHDGDMDYVITNFGFNTTYSASENQPAVLLYADMDDDGSKDIIEARTVDKSLVPVRDKNALLDAMPIFAEEWGTFHQFAKSTLVDLFGRDKLKSAQRLEAATLASGVLLNDGLGRFEFRALPRIAQVSPGFAPAIVDVDADGHNDVYFVQNFYAPSATRPRWTAVSASCCWATGRVNYGRCRRTRAGWRCPGTRRD